MRAPRLLALIGLIAISSRAIAAPVTIDFSYTVSFLNDLSTNTIVQDGNTYSGTITWDNALARDNQALDFGDGEIQVYAATEQGCITLADGQCATTNYGPAGTPNVTYAIDTPYGPLTPLDQFFGRDISARTNDRFAPLPEDIFSEPLEFASIQRSQDGSIQTGVPDSSTDPLTFTGTSRGVALSAFSRDLGTVLSDLTNLDVVPNLLIGSSIHVISANSTQVFIPGAGWQTTYSPNSFELYGGLTAFSVRSVDVPEPETLPLFGIGVVALVLSLSRRRHKHSC